MKEIKRYIKKPVTIEAMVFDGTEECAKDIIDWMGGVGKGKLISQYLIIPTLEGDHSAIAGDYIIKGVKGEFYPCKPDIFAMTYTEGDKE